MADKFQAVPERFARKTEVVKYIILDGVSYMLRRTLCGKNCKGCPHGPYWFARVRRHGVEREIYIGKTFRTLNEFNAEKKRKREEKKRGSKPEEQKKRGMIKT